jgi:hypothetical protein
MMLIGKMELFMDRVIDIVALDNVLKINGLEDN